MISKIRDLNISYYNFKCSCSKNNDDDDDFCCDDNVIPKKLQEIPQKQLLHGLNHFLKHKDDIMLIDQDTKFLRKLNKIIEEFLNYESIQFCLSNDRSSEIYYARY